MSEDFDAIVIGSGITGGWAAKELTERGLKTLVLERGREVRHGTDYMDQLAPWELPGRDLGPAKYEDTGQYFMARRKGWVFKASYLPFLVDDKAYPYSFPEGRLFMWTRGYQTGGRSLTWGRQTYRWGPKDFESNRNDGHGVDWPIRYDDIASWYSYVEKFAGISGAADGLPDLPDSVCQPPFEMSCVEKSIGAKIKARFPERAFVIGRLANLTAPTEEQQKLGRGQCQSRNYCMRGCSYGAYFSSQAATLPAARATGKLTMVHHAIVQSLVQDPRTGRLTGVRVIDHDSKTARIYTARLVFLCASTPGSIQLLLNSRGAASPNGLGNANDVVGRYITDHLGTASANGVVEGFDDRYFFGRRPSGVYIPNYRHGDTGVDFLRGYAFDAYGSDRLVLTPEEAPGIGAGAKAKVNQFGPWVFRAKVAGEMLPYPDNRATLHPTKVDGWGIPQIHLDCTQRANEEKMVAQAQKDLIEMLEVGGCTNVKVDAKPEDKGIVGYRTHEMGGAVMGRDPRTSVTDGWGRVHDVPNLFVCGGPVMASCGTVNPSLTYMALTARSVDRAVKLMRGGAV